MTPSRRSSSRFISRRSSRLAPAVGAIAAQRAVAGDDAMAWDQQADRVPPDRATDRPRRAWGADLPSDLAIARRLAPRDGRDSFEHPPVPLRPVDQVEPERTSRRPTRDERLDSGDRLKQVNPTDVVGRHLSRVDGPARPGASQGLTRTPARSSARRPRRHHDPWRRGGTAPTDRGSWCEWLADPASGQSRTAGPLVYSQGV